jgi:hypothetical protein
MNPNKMRKLPLASQSIQDLLYGGTESFASESAMNDFRISQPFQKAAGEDPAWRIIDSAPQKPPCKGSFGEYAAHPPEPACAVFIEAEKRKLTNY